MQIFFFIVIEALNYCYWDEFEYGKAWEQIEMIYQQCPDITCADRMAIEYENLVKLLIG